MSGDAAMALKQNESQMLSGRFDAAIQGGRLVVG